MLENFVEKVKGFLMSPTETFQDSRDDGFGEAFVYCLATLVIYAALNSAMIAFGFANFAGTPLGLADAGASFIGIIIGGILCILIVAILMHIFIVIVGGRKGIEQTFKVVFYAMTPGFLFGWIPVIGIIANLWSLVLEVIGIRELHEISTARAVLAVFLPLIILIILIILAFLVIAFFTVESFAVHSVSSGTHL